MVTEVKKDELIDFATFCNACFDDLEPWTSYYDYMYEASRPAYGGVAQYAHDAAPGRYDGLIFRYTPMSVEEFEEASKKKLNPEFDPGAARSWYEEGELLGFPLPNGGNSVYTRENDEDEKDKWDDFYLSGGRHEGGEWISDTSTTDAPWTDPLKNTWDAAVRDRLAEVDQVRYELGYLMKKLVTAAEHYADIDLENKLNIERKYDSYVGGNRPV